MSDNIEPTMHDIMEDWAITDDHCIEDCFEGRCSGPATSQTQSVSKICSHHWYGDSCLNCLRKMCELFPVPPGTEAPIGDCWMQNWANEWEEHDHDYYPDE